jgi:hypothetical protein
MAASAFNIYNNAKRYLVDGTLDLDTDTIVSALYKSDSNASTFTLSLLSEVTGSVAGQAGYPGNKTLTISIGDTGLSTMVDSTDLVFTASGADLTSVMFLVIAESGGKLICWCALSTALFSVTSGNTLTVTINAAGVFTMQ